jgi:hypothetical protein
MNEVTFIFTVGGHEGHYQNMTRCIETIEQNYPDAKFLILEFGDSLDIKNDRFTIVKFKNLIDFSSGKKVGYLIWKHKYLGALMINTKYGVYVDTDTVLANDTIPLILQNLDGGIGVSLHFWTPTISHYEAFATTRETYFEFLNLKNKLQLQDDTHFFAGGVFLFEKNSRTIDVFCEILKMYYDYYGNDKEYVKSITDELFLAAVLNKNKDLVRYCNGALNHCSMGDEFMPMIEENNFLFGRNPFDSDFAPITFLHCDTNRRDPSEMYSGTIKQIIRKKFKLDE